MANMPDIIVNLLLFLLHLEEKHRGLLEALKKRGADSVEVPLFQGTPDHYETVGNMIREEVGFKQPTAVAMTTANADLSSRNRKIRARGVKHFKWLVDCTLSLGATRLVGPYTSAWAVWPKDRKGHDLAGTKLVEHMESRLEVSIPDFQEALDYAAEWGVEVDFEYLIGWELPYFNTIEHAVAFLKKLDRRNAGVTVDTAHQVAGSGMRRLYFLLKQLQKRKAPIHIHISAPVHRGDIVESSIPFFEFLSVLKTLGINESLVIEIFNAVAPFAQGARLNRRAWTYEECLAIIAKGIRHLRNEWTRASDSFHFHKTVS